MKSIGKKIFGLALVAAGIIAILVITGVISLDISYEGWWAFFIIIPCFCGLFSGKDIIGSLIGMSVGVLLFLSARGVIAWGEIWKLLLAVVAIGIGIKLIFNLKGNNRCSELKDFCINENGVNIRHIENCFGQQKLSFEGEKVEGLSIENSFGTTILDLRKAVIENNLSIYVDIAFGGVEILIPDGFAVKTGVNSGFGGVCDKRVNTAVDAEKPTIVIAGKCGFGGLTLR